MPVEKQREDVKDDPQEIEELFAAAMNAKDGERDISLVFQLLPQRSVSYQSGVPVTSPEICKLSVWCSSYLPRDP
jgi:hypothetical protein